MNRLMITYNWPIVIISIVVAIFASYTTIELVKKTKVSDRKVLWLSLSAITMGFGIWTMHFTGMLAVKTNTILQYDLIATILSLFIAMMASFFAFGLMIYKLINQRLIWLAAVILGLGISVMHYIGMYGIVAVDITYRSVWVVLSILLGILGSYFVLKVIAKKLSDDLFIYQFLVSCVLGGTISLMHYVAMKAAQVYMLTEERLQTYQFYTISSDSDYMLVTLIIVISILFIVLNTIMLKEKKHQHLLKYLAFHDSLTGLPNRYKLDKFINELIVKKQKNNHSFSVLFLDLNDFKSINDLHGHDIGDQILVIVANRLKDAVKNKGMSARLGGDEFILVLDLSGSSRTEQVVAQIKACFNEPIVIEDQEFKISPSIGVSIYPDDGVSVEALIKKADEEMYKVKKTYGMFTTT